MIYRGLVIILFILFSINVNSQSLNHHMDFAQEQLEQRQELYFKFEIAGIEDAQIVKILSNIISIDGVRNNTVYAYANPNEFEEFLTFGIDFEPVYDYYYQPKNLTMATSVAQMQNWDRYPTFAVYEQMMNDFATDYPEMARLDTIGFSVNGYPILCIVISSNVNTPADKPKYWWSSNMHGDELAGYVILLRLADYLLSNYGDDSQVTNLLDNTYIYIDPLANPDGTYFNSPDYDDVSGSRRNNANNVDLNRNYPYIEGTSPTTQIEAQIAMDYAQEHGFTMSANAHGGIELINYPWDFWTSAQNPHADDNWWQYVSYMYADLAQANSPPGYFTGQGDGVTHGGDWYVVNGSRQDWMNYYSNVREVTLEWHNTKKLPAADLPAHWDYNKQAILDYTEQILYGFRGIITDACTNEPIIGAKVEIVSHDKDNSEVYSFAPIGNYHRLIYEGTYEVTFSADGYHDFVTTVNVINNQSTRIDVELYPENVAVPDFFASLTNIFEGQSVDFTNETTGSVTSYSWFFPGGTPTESSDENPENIIYNNQGFYSVILEIESNGCLISEEKEDYIKVFEPQEPVADFVADNTEVPAGTYVNFTDISLNVPDSWSWTFEGGNPANSTDQNPEVFYETPGIYDVSLIASNQYGEDEIIKTDYITVGLPSACNAGGNNINFMYISDFSLNTINNPSEASQYSDFTNISTDLIIGSSYSFFVEAGEAYDWNQCIIWIDWNGDGVFEEEEEVYRSEIENALEYNGTIEVPEGLNPGPVRLRVRVHYNRPTFDPNDTPCGFSGYGEVEDYTVNLIIPETPPVADFNYEITDICSGTVQFFDNSSYAESWEWNFGDGNTSVLQNPSHTYNESGTYTIQLTVTNAFGTDIHEEIDIITIELPQEPITTGDEACGESELTLYAEGNGVLQWFDNPMNGTLINTGDSYTSFFSETSSLYVQSVIDYSILQNGGKEDNSSTGGYFSGDAEHGLIFNAESEFILKSVLVYSNSSGIRTIRLIDGEDNELESVSIDIPEGESRVELNFNIPQGAEYQLLCSGNADLYRNGAPTAQDLPYPYVIEDILSIYSNTAEGLTDAYLSYYYYFYDWEIETSETCVSNRIPVTATIHAVPIIDLGDDVVQCGGSVILDAGEDFVMYNWNGTPGNHTHEVTDTETVNLTVTDENSCEASDAVNITIHPEINVTVSTTDESSAGANDGTATAIVTGGTSPFDYEWNTGAETELITDLAAGTYHVTISDSNDCEAYSSGVVNQGNIPSPIADFEVNITQGCDELTVQFTDISENNPTSWIWDFGDGNSSTNQNPEHTFTSHGLYTVSLTVTNAGGSDIKEITDLITIGETPQITLSMTEESQPDANDGTATVTVTSAYEFSIEWDNQDQTETIEGLTAGIYCVTVVNNNIACPINDCIEVTTGDINNNPIADFFADITQGCDELTVQFTDISENNPTSWIWDFGDGFGSVLQNPSHTYDIPGLYTVNLTVINDDGQDNKTIEDYILVGERPILDFEVTHESGPGVEDGAVTVLISGGQEPYTIFWSNNENSPTISNLSAGLYSVAVTEANNCSRTGVVEVMVSTNIAESQFTNIQVYPNPTEGILNVTSDVKIDKLSIINIIGQAVISSNPNCNNVKMDLSPLNQGVYLLKIESDNNIIKKKVVVQ